MVSVRLRQSCIVSTAAIHLPLSSLVFDSLLLCLPFDISHGGLEQLLSVLGFTPGLLETTYALAYAGLPHPFAYSPSSSFH